MSTIATTTSKQGPLDFMIKLSQAVYLLQPVDVKPAATIDGPIDPRLIIIAGWMDARDNHLAKYVQEYWSRYPASNILLLRARVNIMLSRETARNDVAIALPVIQGLLADTNDKPRLLVHAFSNGGSCLLSTLNETYREPNGTLPGSLPLHVTIFDSAPSMRYDHAAGVTAILAGIPTGIVKTVFAPFLKIFSLVWLFSIRVLRFRDSMVRLAISHNDRSTIRETSRTYIYSSSDKLVNYKEVEEHAAQARKHGFKVSTELFKASPHVAHARTDGVRYWDIVASIWNDR